MHSLTIVFGPAATAWTLLFKEEEKAAVIYNAYTNARVTGDAGAIIGSDDFGQTITMHSDDIHGMMFEDMDLSQIAMIERGLHQARSQAKAQMKAADDPVIREGIRKQQQGPAVYQPGMGAPNGRMM